MADCTRRQPAAPRGRPTYPFTAKSNHDAHTSTGTWSTRRSGEFTYHAWAPSKQAATWWYLLVTSWAMLCCLPSYAPVVAQDETEVLDEELVEEPSADSASSSAAESQGPRTLLQKLLAGRTVGLLIGLLSVVAVGFHHRALDDDSQKHVDAGSCGR